jgi:hypothetical protein
VIFTKRGDLITVVSARDVNKKERKFSDEDVPYQSLARIYLAMQISLERGSFRNEFYATDESV